MNLDKAVELLKIISTIPVGNLAKHPEVRIVCATGEVMARGYTLSIEKKSADEDYRKHLSKIAKSQKLAILESDRHIILYCKSA